MALLEPPIEFEGGEPARANDVNLVINDIYYELNNLGGRGGYSYRSITGDNIQIATISNSNVDGSVVTTDSQGLYVNPAGYPIITDLEFTIDGNNISWGAYNVQVKGILKVGNEGEYVLSDTTTDYWFFIDDTTLSVVSDGVMAGSSFSAGPTKWILYRFRYSGGWIAEEAFQAPIIHGEVIQANTITADQLSVTLAYAGDIIIYDDSGTATLTVGTKSLGTGHTDHLGSGMYSDDTGIWVAGNPGATGSYIYFDPTFNSGQGKVYIKGAVEIDASAANGYGNYACYQWSTGTPSQPATGDFTIDTSGVISKVTGSWNLAPGTGSGDLYVCYANIQVPTSTYTVQSSDWSTATIISGADGADGTNGTNGTDGADGDDGTSIYYQSTEPTGSVVGDIFIPTISFTGSISFTAGNVYSWNGAAWVDTTAVSIAGALVADFVLANNMAVTSTISLGSASTAGVITLSTINNSAIRTGTKTPGSTTNGIFIGRYGGYYQFDITNNPYYFRWDGQNAPKIVTNSGTLGTSGDTLYDIDNNAIVLGNTSSGSEDYIKLDANSTTPFIDMIDYVSSGFYKTLQITPGAFVVGYNSSASTSSVSDTFTIYHDNNGYGGFNSKARTGALSSNYSYFEHSNGVFEFGRVLSGATKKWIDLNDNGTGYIGDSASTNYITMTSGKVKLPTGEGESTYPKTAAYIGHVNSAGTTLTSHTGSGGSIAKGSGTGYYTLTLPTGNWIVHFNTPRNTAGIACMINGEISGGYFDSGTTDNVYIERQDGGARDQEWYFIAHKI